MAAPTRSKLELLKELGIRETYQISRDGAAACREEILKNHPHGFDIVVDATGSEKVAEEAIQYLKKTAGWCCMLYTARMPGSPSARISLCRISSGSLGPLHSAIASPGQYRQLTTGSST